MLVDLLLNAARLARRIGKDIDHFSIEKVGSKYYVYAHTMPNRLNRKKIGTYADYETAKNAVDSIIDLKLPRDMDI